jgi:hypothetical protein
MFDQLNALDRIERAERATPFCECGQPTVPVARDGGVWLECRSLQAAKPGIVGRLAHILTGAGHTRRLVVAPEEMALAA